MSEPVPATTIVFFGMQIDLYQWISFFTGAQMVRLSWEAWMSFCAKPPTYLSQLMVPMVYLGYSTSIALVITSCTAVYAIKVCSSNVLRKSASSPKCAKAIAITAYISYALTTLSFADSLTSVIATAVARQERISNCMKLYKDAPPCSGCDADQFCTEILLASLMWQTIGIVLNLMINALLAVSVHQYYIQMNKASKPKKSEKPTLNTKEELDAEGFQVVELK
ncbi:hypothetical protein Unana1_05352 [Umbelopsis nana]